MKRILIAALLCTLTGCATIRNHPVIAGAAVAFVATSIALSSSHDPSSHPMPVARRK